MPGPAGVPLPEIIATCEKLYARDGFVKWSDVAAVHGLSRQAIQLRLKGATARGELAPGTMERWMSMTARHAAAREREKQRLKDKSAKDRYEQTFRLTHENYQWLREQSVLRRATAADLLNGLITREREASADT